MKRIHFTDVLIALGGGLTGYSLTGGHFYLMPVGLLLIVAAIYLK